MCKRYYTADEIRDESAEFFFERFEREMCAMADVIASEFDYELWLAAKILFGLDTHEYGWDDELTDDEYAKLFDFIDEDDRADELADEFPTWAFDEFDDDGLIII